MVSIAIDGMGGDNAPFVVIKGLEIFHQRCPSVNFILFGDEKQLMPLMKGYPSLLRKTEIVHTDEAISARMKPSYVMRNLKKSSMRLALEAVAKGEARGAISAGNTGAYMVLSKIILKTLPGIHRPAIASQLPSKRGESVMLDLGGNLETEAKNLVDYGMMGSLFAKHVLGIEYPSIGILNVGSEESKGKSSFKEAFGILNRSSVNFYGFIEGNDIMEGAVDVIVTDGFTGNIALKTGEGAVKLMLGALKKSFASSLRGRMAGMLARPLFKEFKEHYDPRSYNGAIWLGLNGIAVKSHGGADKFGFAHALEMVFDMIKAEINFSISREITNFSI